ncbi:hypothetical protein EBI00_02465 [Marinomonas hwangdonensis]|uniref:Uncharacterized protein n=1 Tax=Marinomonas hwangdonensis TaxID=1053647 RepID=A0A3M8QA92_9GAMM|nr:hypothetical protein [Marinomonas hwangdonensis]RNF52983.1 hypothetical protein EBI00_02465 [Marinomonas hwangdonensis]
MKVTIIRAILYWFGDLLLKAALDAASKRALKNAVDVAEKSGGKGQQKMVVALDYLRKQGTESLRSATESKLRTLIEEQLDRI